MNCIIVFLDHYVLANVETVTVFSACTDRMTLHNEYI